MQLFKVPTTTGHTRSDQIVVVRKHPARLSKRQIRQKFVYLIDYFIMVDIAGHTNDDVATHVLFAVVFEHHLTRYRLNAFNSACNVSTQSLIRPQRRIQQHPGQRPRRVVRRPNLLQHHVLLLHNVRLTEQRRLDDVR